MKKSKKNSALFAVLLSGGVAAAVMLIFFSLNGIFPFGENDLMRNDAVAQYVPLLAEYVSRIKSGSSLMYSFSNGMGSSFYATLCYYLLSPFNLLALLFPVVKVNFAFDLIVLVKTMFIAGSMAFYLSKKFGKRDFSTVVFALLYTFCGFFAAYYYNTMWLDALIMLPLIALGIEKIVAGKSRWMYFGALAFAIFTNFYMGYMLCIFSVLYFFVLVFSNPLTQKNAKFSSATTKSQIEEAPISQVVLNFGASSLFAGLASCAVLLPIYCALQGAATKNAFNDSDLFFNVFDFLSYHLDGVSIPSLVMTNETLPNVFCGVLSFILLPLYFCSKKIRLNEKIANAVLVLILFASFIAPPLNYFWHGFSAPAFLPYRFSFIYSFILIVIAYKTFINIKAVPLWAFILPTALVSTAAVYTKFSQQNTYSNKTIIISAIAFVVFTAILLLKKYEKLNSKIISLLLIVAVSAEIVVGQGVNIGSFKIPVEKAYSGYNEIPGANNELKKIDRGFYRLEQTRQSTFSSMNGGMYGTNTATAFSSLADYRFSITQYSLGDKGNMMNDFEFDGQTLPYNALFGIKYIYDTGKTAYDENPYYETAVTGEEGNTYKNKYTLPLGYVSNTEILKWEPLGKLPFNEQNDLWQSVTGQNDVMTVIEPSAIDLYNSALVDKQGLVEYAKNSKTEEPEEHHEGEEEHQHLTLADLAQFVNEQGGNYPYRVTDDGYSISFKFTAKSTGEMYILRQSSSLKTMTVKYPNGDEAEFENTINNERSITDIGYFNDGETAEIVFSNPRKKLSDFNADEPMSDSVFIQAATLNHEAFQNGYNQILENGTLNMTEFQEDYIKGTVNASKDGVMMMSMPQDDGWTILIDGVPTETLENGAHIMMFNVTQGEHTIEMKFFPTGLKEGLFISGASVLALILFSVLFKLRKNRKDEPIELAEEENLDADFVRKSQTTQENTDSQKKNSDNAKE